MRYWATRGSGGGGPVIPVPAFTDHAWNTRPGQPSTTLFGGSPAVVGGAIDQWVAEVGGVDLLQADPVRQPKGAATVDGQTPPTFTGTTGVNEFMDAAIGNIGNITSMCVVIEQYGTAGGSQAFFDSPSGGAGRQTGFYDVSNQYGAFAGLFVPIASPPVALGLTALQFIWNGASSLMRKDGVESANYNAGSQVTDGFRIGANTTAVAGLQGIIRAAFVSDEAWTPAQRAEMEAFCQSVYNTP